MVKPSSYKLLWDREALDQFKEILTYLDKQSSQASNTVKSGVLDRLKLIMTNPLICETDQLKTPPDNHFRAFVIFSIRVTYQIKIEQREIRILRIRHTSREPMGY